MPRRRCHRRRTEAEWAEVLRRFESSGQSAREFCRRERVSPSSFQRWRSRLGTLQTTEFVELVPTQVTAAPESTWSLDVALPNGVQLRSRG